YVERVLGCSQVHHARRWAPKKRVGARHGSKAGGSNYLTQVVYAPGETITKRRAGEQAEADEARAGRPHEGMVLRRSAGREAGARDLIEVVDRRRDRPYVARQHAQVLKPA